MMRYLLTYIYSAIMDGYTNEYYWNGPEIMRSHREGCRIVGYPYVQVHEIGEYYSSRYYGTLHRAGVLPSPCLHLLLQSGQLVEWESALLPEGREGQQAAVDGVKVMNGCLYSKGVSTRRGGSRYGCGGGGGGDICLPGYGIRSRMHCCSDALFASARMVLLQRSLYVGGLSQESVFQ